MNRSGIDKSLRRKHASEAGDQDACPLCHPHALPTPSIEETDERRTSSGERRQARTVKRSKGRRKLHSEAFSSPFNSCARWFICLHVWRPVFTGEQNGAERAERARPPIDPPSATLQFRSSVFQLASVKLTAG